jgi:hypothetical protein
LAPGANNRTSGAKDRTWGADVRTNQSNAVSADIRLCWEVWTPAVASPLLCTPHVRSSARAHSAGPLSVPPHSLPSLSALPGSGLSHSGHPCSARSHNPVVCRTLVRIRRLCFPHIRIPCQLSWSLTDSCGCPDSAGPACPCASCACAFSRWRDSPHLLFSACPHSERAHCVCAPCGCVASARSQCACREMRLFAVRSLSVLQTGGVRVCEGPSGRPQKDPGSSPGGRPTPLS